LVYLDNNATTELSQDASSILMDLILHDIYGNPSSQHDLGSKVRAVMAAARFGVAQSLGCSSGEIVFTSGGTEANNLALRGVYNPQVEGERKVVISAAEHPSVLYTAEAVAGDENVVQIPLLSCGALDVVAARDLIRADTALVSVMLANNETGVIFPIKEIADLAHTVGALVHCDAVQAYGRIPIDVHELGVDLLSISGHKAHALAGVGALYIKKDLLVHPVQTGGGQEYALRAGTENYIGIASLGAAANEVHLHKGMSSGLRDAFEAGLKRRVPDIVINGEDAPRIPNTSSITFKGVHSLAMLTALEEEGVLASAGAACSSRLSKPSHVLLAMGVSEEDAVSTVRFSFSRFSKIMDAATAIDACVKCTNILRQGGD
jgi:cysteine desulfurase